MALSMSASLGWGRAASSAAAAMIWPGWQYPHCTTSSSIQARCTASRPWAERPSIVLTACPWTLAAGVTHERTAWPSTWTVHAPHCAIPQPNLVPVRPRMSRSTQSRGMSSGAAASYSLPLTLSFMDPSCHGSGPPVNPLFCRGSGGSVDGSVAKDGIELDEDVVGGCMLAVAVEALGAGKRRRRRPRPVAEAEVGPSVGKPLDVLDRRLQGHAPALEEPVPAGGHLLRRLVQLEHEDRLVG